jgi:hypothetical protein
MALVVVIAVAAVTWAGGASAPVGATTRTNGGEDGGKVVVIAAPRLTWDVVRRVHPPHLDDVFRQAAVASTSVRAVQSTTSPGAAYLTLGAGSRAVADPGVDGSVLALDETYDRSTAANIFHRLSGRAPTSPIVAVGFPRLSDLNEEERFGTEIGSLASALESGHRSAAVVANADDSLDFSTRRQAGLFGADRTGQVAGGKVDHGLLQADELAPSGLRLNPDATVAAFESAWRDHDVVLVELSDLERAEQARSETSEVQANRIYDGMLRADDAIVGRLLRHVDLRHDRVIVVGPTAPLADEQLTVFALAGAGIEPGWAMSSTTRREGFVSLTDVAPSILDHFGIAVPSSMNDTPLSSHANDLTMSQRIEQMVDANDRARSRDEAVGPTTVIWIIVLVATLTLAVLCLARFRRLAGLVTTLANVVLAVPIVAFLLGLLPIGGLGPAALGTTIFAGGLVVAVLVTAATRRRPTIGPIALIGAVWLVLAVDIVTGGHLQINTVFGYSPIVAGRFAGFGNQAFSFFAMSAVVMVTAGWEAVGARRAPRWFVPAVIAFFVVSIVLDGYPAFGSDVGGVLAIVPTAAVLLLSFTGRRIRARTALLIGLGTVAVLGAFAAIDLSRPASERTHLGRFAAKLFDGDALGILERKLQANYSVLTSSFFSWVIPVALVFFGYLTWRPNHTTEQLRRRHPGFHLLERGGLILGVLAMLLNDSGVSMPAVMLSVALAYTTILAIDIETRASPPPPDST